VLRSAMTNKPLLRSYDLRGNPPAEARPWFVRPFPRRHTRKKLMQKYPQGSQENTQTSGCDQLLGKWLPGICDRGLINDELVLRQWRLWVCGTGCGPSWPLGAAFKNPTLFSGIEKSLQAAGSWRERPLRDLPCHAPDDGASRSKMK